MAGKRPTFMVHRSYNGGARLPEVFNELSVSHGDKLGLGAVVRMTNTNPEKAAAFMSTHSRVPLRMLDPELHHAPNSVFEQKELKATALKWPFLAEIPAQPSKPWVRQVLKAQLDTGATVLLSASGWVHDINAPISMKKQMQFVAESRQLAGSRDMMVNLTLDYRWLTESPLRDLLFETIVEQTERHWYLRFYWPIIATRYGQLLEWAILEGYKELVALCADEEKVLFLPNVGLSGWVATALGAAGFSTGQSWPEQAFARQQVMASRKGVQRAPAIPRFYEPTMLHTTEYVEHLRLENLAGHLAEDDTFALEIQTDGHQSELAGLHYLVSAGNLQAQLSTRSPRSVARKEVRRASGFLETLGRTGQPAGPNRPQHLPLWLKLLA
ncbi:hypothetical protein KN200_14585 [Clavibacter michiganensis subsp. michiganensis]|nr:hypothetical protein [Clavibacter michiganensis]QXP05772.1 hypothetical protein KN200_14585 [Clavibacter michiganensis subsp. michiganensis]